MKRLYIVVIASVVFALLAFPGVSYADFVPHPDNNYKVEFTTQGKMKESYPAYDLSKEIADTASNMQPGDYTEFEVKLIHSYDTACDWYMNNDVLQTLKKMNNTSETNYGDPNYSAYDYELIYTKTGKKKSNSRILYSTKEIGGGGDPGGNKTNGLEDVSNALENYFYIDKLAKGDTAEVKLKISLDGETESNSYFDTFAQVKMQFAVELPTTNKNESTSSTRGSDRNVVQTGDETNLFPFYVAMAVSGALLLILGIYSLRSRKREREQG